MTTQEFIEKLKNLAFSKRRKKDGYSIYQLTKNIKKYII